VFDAPIRRRVRVFGRVQGVWFRDATRRRAHALRVAGWVRNREDGSVEAVFEGPPDRVEAAVAFCRTGPPGARVAHLECRDEAPEGLTDFTIRR